MKLDKKQKQLILGNIHIAIDAVDSIDTQVYDLRKKIADLQADIHRIKRNIKPLTIPDSDDGGG